MRTTARVLTLLLALCAPASRLLAASSQYPALLQKALDGDLHAACALGPALLQGAEGAPKDPAAAVPWLRRCADSGNPFAQTQLGFLYANGIGVAEDRAASVRWFQRAAVSEYAPAQFDLGMMYLEGAGVAADLNQALHWLTRAAQKGDAKAQLSLALLYVEGRPGLPPDVSAGLQWLRASANAHFLCAEYDLAMLDRTSSKPKEAAARKWLARATHHRDADGQLIDVNRACGIPSPAATDQQRGVAAPMGPTAP